MRRSDHPSRPSAITCCRFSALKTLPIPAAGVKPTAHVNVSAPGAALAGFQVSINGRFWVSTEAPFRQNLRHSLRRAGLVGILEPARPERLPARFRPARATSGNLRAQLLARGVVDAEQIVGSRWRIAEVARSHRSAAQPRPNRR